MHELRGVMNAGVPGSGMALRPGLVPALEPMFIAGDDDRYEVETDGWALRTADGSLAAHVEHGVAITEDGPVVRTL